MSKKARSQNPPDLTELVREVRNLISNIPQLINHIREAGRREILVRDFKLIKAQAAGFIKGASRTASYSLALSGHAIRRRLLRMHNRIVGRKAILAMA